MLFKLSNLNSNLALTLDYLNPALNNSALLNKLKAMLRVLSTTFKPVNNLICCWVVKQATSLFHSCIVSLQVARFLLSFFPYLDSNVRSCSKKWRKERSGAEIERFLSEIARAWIILFSQRSHYLRAWHRLPRNHSFTTYQSPHDDTGQ